jgi:hypothetical protein
MFKQESKHKYLLNKRLLFKTLQGPIKDLDGIEEDDGTRGENKEGGSNEEQKTIENLSVKIENLVDGRESIVPPIDTIKTSNINSINSNSNS